MPFKKGQSGNPGGRKREQFIWRNAIERAITRASKEGMQVVDDLADALITKAKDGDVPALKEIGDRLDGKVPQVLQGDDQNPLFPKKIEIEIVRPQSQGS